MGAKIVISKALRQVRVGGYLKASLLIQTTFEIEAVQNNETTCWGFPSPAYLFSFPIRYLLVALL